MYATRSVAAALLLAVIADHRAFAQQPIDTARYVVLFSGRPAGEYREWWANGELHSVYEYNDRGRGPHQEAVLKLGDSGVPSSLSIVGHGYLKDSVDERFSSDGGTATWKTSSEHGSQAMSGPAYYVSGSESPIGSQLLIKSALAHDGRLPLLPSGEATVTKSGR